MTRTFFVAVSLLLLCSPSQATAQAEVPLRGLLVLIDFPDEPATIPLSRVEDVINGVGYSEPGVTRSLRDYWHQQSRGQVVLTHEVVGYYRAPQPASWYRTQTFDAFIELTRNALDWLVDTRPDFDWESLSRASGRLNRHPDGEDGTFLAVSFLSTAWIPGIVGTHWLTGWTAPNGVQPRQIVGATLVAPWESDINLFWLTHELGHSIWGWPDTYDNTGNSHGTGLYSLMSGNQGTGDIEPVGGPFLLAEGWVRPVEIRKRRNVVLQPDGRAVVLHRNPADSREYFVIEAREDTTVGNSAFPARMGLLVWHVDERVTTANTRPQMTPAEHYRVSVEQADGRFDLERQVNTGDGGDIYLPGTTFGVTGTPDSRWWDGSASNLEIDEIRFLDSGQVSFRASIEAAGSKRPKAETPPKRGLVESIEMRSYQPGGRPASGLL